MKNITKENLESFGVQCPSDYKTNQKWKDIIDAFNLIDDNIFEGNLVNEIYGFSKVGTLLCGGYFLGFNKIISIDEAWDYFYGEDFNTLVQSRTELTKPNTKRIQEIEQQMMELSAELKQLKNKCSRKI